MKLKLGSDGNIYDEDSGKITHYKTDKIPKQKERNLEKEKRMKNTILYSVIIIIIIIFFLMSFGWNNISPTDVGVQVNKISGDISKNPVGMGYAFYNKWKTDIIVYRVAARAFPTDVEASEKNDKYYLKLKTNDGQNVDVDLTIIYSLKANEVPSLHQHVGKNYEDQIILPLIRSEARIAVGSYSAEEIYQGKVREIIQQRISEKLKNELGKYPAIQIQDALIRHFQFSKDYERAIEQKTLASQQIEINKNLAKAQEQKALQQEAEARGAKLQAIQAAEGHAQSLKINANASRYSLEQEAAGNLAKYKAEAEGKKLLTEAVGGGQNLVALTFAQNIPDKLQIWGIPTGQSNVSIQDLSGVFSNMIPIKK